MSHRAKKTRRKVKKLNIIPVFLPPYSPDLNPIEQIWRIIKRVLSPLFIKTLDELKEVISSSFYGLTQRIIVPSKTIYTKTKQQNIWEESESTKL
ncbi:MAG: transposase [Candidatus Syntropharchaeia archaeon]